MPNCSHALESEARKKTAPAGYTVCNDSRDVLLVALGQTDGGKAGVARLVDGAAGRLRQDHHHAAEQRCGLSAGAEEGRQRAGGRTARFLHHHCGFRHPGRGKLRRPRVQRTAGFATTPTKGVAGYVAHIGAAGLRR